jgi:xanthine/uracil permease
MTTSNFNKQAPAASFIWVKTFPLIVYGPLVLPMMTIFIICACEAVGDITATCDGKLYKAAKTGLC